MLKHMQSFWETTTKKATTYRLLCAFKYFRNIFVNQFKIMFSISGSDIYEKYVLMLYRNKRAVKIETNTKQKLHLQTKSVL